jgi:NAD(P)H dehydrogenase (quinone)
MKAQIIICHPNSESFNHAIASKAEKVLIANGYQIIFHDLYKEDFNPVLPYGEIIQESFDPKVKEYIRDLNESDMLIIVHPNWWGKPPALLSGWIDRVLRLQVAYTFPKGGEGGKPIGLLNLKRVFIFNTANTTTERESEVFGDPLNLIWKNCVFDFCGVPSIVRKIFTVVVDSTLEQRNGWLDEVEQILVKSLDSGWM